MSIVSRIAFSSLLASAACCVYLPTKAQHQSENEKGSVAKRRYFRPYFSPIGHGFALRVIGHSATILNDGGIVCFQNQNLIRMRDDQGDCPSEGFQNVVVKGDYFTIEQQNCSGSFFIDEYVTFKLVAGKFQLHKMGFNYTDRNHPDATIPDDILTEKDFGKLEFEKVELDTLYRLRERRKR